jgi:hypothetical protein
MNGPRKNLRLLLESMPKKMTMRSNRKSRKQTRRQAGGNFRVYYGKITNSAGKNFTNSNFSKGNSRGFNSYWQDINKSLEEHVNAHFAEAEIVSSGFGGDDGSGTVVVKSKKSLPAMNFSVAGKNYKMSFDRFENNNSA